MNDKRLVTVLAVAAWIASVLAFGAFVSLVEGAAGLGSVEASGLPFTIECPNEDHPNTAVLAVAVNPKCPHKSGPCQAIVDDYTTKPADGKPVTYHRLRSVTSCGCVTTVKDLCKCIPNGTYEGVCIAFHKDKKADEFDASECHYVIRCEVKK